MKIPFITLVALAAITIGLIAGCHQKGQTMRDHPYILTINGNFLPVKDPKNFEDTLNGPGLNDSSIRVRVNSSGVGDKCGPPFSSATATPCPQLPENKIGVHVTQYVTADSEGKFQQVLNSFASPTASPTVIP